MRIRKKIDFSKLFFYLLFFIAAFFLNQIGDNGEPFALTVFYAVSTVGFSSCFSLLYPLTCLSVFSSELFLLYLVQGVLLCVGFLIQQRLHKTDFIKTGILPMLCLSVALGLFVAFSPFTAYNFSAFTFLKLNALTQKVLFAALIFLLSAIACVAVKALMRKFLKCRLRNDETIFLVLLCVLIGVGICRFWGVNEIGRAHV